MSGVAVVILAAGMSRRLGRPKQLLQLDGEPLIAHVARAAVASQADEVLVVLGAYADDVRAVLEDIVDDFVFNDDFQDGQGTSIATPFDYLDIISEVLGPIDAVVYVLADQPGVSAEVINQVIGEWNNGASIVMARYSDRASHPVLFGRDYWPELKALAGDQGGRDVIARHPEAVRFVEVASNAPLDVDTEADWRTLQEFWVSKKGI